MELNMEIPEKSAYESAKKKAREIRSFYINLCCYLIVIPILIFINLKYSPGFYWFIFSAGGWGIGLLIHGLGAFEINPFFNKEWEQRKIRELMEKDRQRRQNFNNGNK